MKNNQDLDLDGVRDRLILSVLPHVMFDGWSDQSLAAGAKELGLDATMPARLFAGGGMDAVAHFVRLADRLMIEDAASVDLTALGDRARLQAVIKLRFDRWGPYREAIRRAVGQLALPINLPLAARLTWGTADAIWTATGKRSHDFSWYTRRGSLSAVFAATLLMWLDDQSENCAETYAFLGRRFDEVTGAIKRRHRAWSWLVQRVPALSRPG